MPVNRKYAAMAGVGLLLMAAGFGGDSYRVSQEDAIEAQKASHLEVIAAAVGQGPAGFWLAYDAGRPVSDYPLPSDMEQQLANAPPVAAAREAIRRIDNEKQQWHLNPGGPLYVASILALIMGFPMSLVSIVKLNHKET